ncbi:MAG: Ig-like domain-containing protein, partial [Oribacterium sp.]|nr:Ig-like domain-containing protein [Oribacterium sp.]
MLRFKVDIALAREGELMLQGWAFGSNPEEEVKLTVVDQAGNPVPGTTVSSVRRDEVVNAFFGDVVKAHGSLQRDLGFDVHTPYAQGETRILVLQADGQTKR